MTNPFGYYRITGVAAGEVYIFTVYAKGYETSEPIVKTVSEDIADFNITLRNQ
jgi:hypothetical protein